MRNPNASSAFVRNAPVFDKHNQPTNEPQTQKGLGKKKKKPLAQEIQEDDSAVSLDPAAVDPEGHEEVIAGDLAQHQPFSEDESFRTVSGQSLTSTIESMLSSGSFGYGALEVAGVSSLTAIGGGAVGVMALASGGGGGSGGGSGGAAVNAAPTVVDTALYLPKLPSGASLPVGRVGALLSTLTGGIYDENSGDPKGIAIVQVDSSLGTLYYSTNNGTTWTLASDVSQVNALLLADNANTRLYFLPVSSAVGIVPNAVFFRAWDQSTGTSGARADVTVNGGATAFSSDVESIALNIDVPVLGDYTENGAPILAYPNLILPEPVSGAFTGATVQIGGGFTAGDILSVAGNAAITVSYDATMGLLTLTGTASRTQYESILRNVSFRSTSDNPTNFGAVRPLIWQVTDAAGNPYVNAVNQVNIIAVNDAPFMFADQTFLTAVGYGSAAPGLNSGDLVSRFTASVVDPDTSDPKTGLAIIKTAPDILLHFSTDGGRTWGTATDLSSTNALHLMSDPDNKFYLQTLPGFTGDASSAFAFRAWDQTAGVDGLRGSTIPAGGTSAYSLAIGGGLAPEFVGPTSVTVPENTDTVIYDASANGDFNVTYSLSGADAARFTIEPSTGKLSFLQAPNFESPLDVGANNQYNVTIVATNPSGRSASMNFTVNVTNVNESVVDAAGLDKNYLTSNDSPGVWVTYSDGVTFGRNIYASAIGPDAVTAIQVRKQGGSFVNMTMENGYAVYHFHDQILPGTYTYEFRSLGADGKYSAITTQEVQVSSWAAAPGYTSITTATHSVGSTTTTSLYGSFNAVANWPTDKGQEFRLGPAAINGFMNNGQPTFLYGGATTDVNNSGGGGITRQTDYLNLVDPGAILNLSALRGNGFSVDKLGGFEFIEMTNPASQAIIADGISLGAISTSGWLSNPYLNALHYSIIIKGSANDALVLRKGGDFDFSNFNRVATATDSAGNFFPGTGIFDVYLNSDTKQYVLLEQGVQISRWAPGVNAAPVIVAINTRAVNNLAEEATATASPVNGFARGVLVSSLAAGVHDADGATVAKGIAITSVNPNGVLFYSTNGGDTWTQAAANISNTNALLLAADSDNRVYFRANSTATPELSNAIVYKAWDQTLGADGAYASTAVSGGTSAFSTAVENARFRTTPDTTAPTLVSSNPSDGGYLTSLSNNITLTFSEPVVQGTGTIQIFRSSDNALIQSFDVATSNLVSGWGTQALTLNPTDALLVHNTAYYIRISPTAISDNAGNSFAGIADSTTFNFTTAAGDGGVVGPVIIDPTRISLGYSVSGAGDVNGDGYDDHLVGGSSADNSVFVVYGNASGTFSNFTGGTIASNKGFRFSSVGNQVGIHLSGVGDVNGDGFDDVMLGSTSSSGLTYVVYGGLSNAGLTTDASGNIPTSSGFKITGSANSGLGYSVSGAGDVNGDGIADLIFGAKGSSITTGSAYVMFGQSVNRTNYNLIGGNIAASEGFEIEGGVGSGLGRWVSSAGDVNGDGLADVVVSGDDKIIYVVYGKANGLTLNLSSKNIAAGDGFKITSLENPSEFGWKVASAGDVNGDGLGDILVSSGATNGVYVVFGNASGSSLVIDGAGNIANGRGFLIKSNVANYLGHSVSSAGDVNGDGLSDIIVGTNLTASAGAFVVYGKSSNTTVSISNGAILSGDGFKINGATTGAFGFSVSGAGDVNGDGLADVLVGSSLAGYTLILGGTQWTASAVSASGTVTGTNTAEAIIGSTGADTLTGGGGVDRFFAGMGNDTIVLTSSDASNLANTTAGGPKASVHGGGGFDTLRLSGTNLDLTAITNVAAMGSEEDSRIESIERIDMATDTASNTLTLTANDVKDMAGFNLIRIGTVSADGNTWTNVTGTALSANTRLHQLVVDGLANDSLSLITSSGLWVNMGTVSNGSSTYNVYQNTATNTQVFSASAINNVVIDSPPILLSSNPSDNGYLMSLSSNITLTFSEPVVQGTGTIGIYRSSDNALIQSFDVATSNLVSGWGTQALTLNPTDALLVQNTQYHIRISAAAIKDNTGNLFAGFGDPTTFNFTTALTDGSIPLGHGDGFTGAVLTARLGSSVSSIGDFNGDGFDDFIVGARTDNGDAGAGYVVFGNAQGQGTDVNTFAGGSTLGFKIAGPGLTAYNVGNSVSGAGDVNGDGFADIIIGASGSALGGRAAYVIYGKASTSGVIEVANFNLGATSNGFKISDDVYGFGGSVSGAGDVNGDGLADMVVSNPTLGVAYVVYGSQTAANLNLSSGAIAATAGFKITGVAGDQLGATVSSAGDINGDGLADVLVATATTGRSYVVYGNSTGSSVVLGAGGTIAAAQGFQITGTTSTLAQTVSSAGDVNGDGLADLVVSSTTATSTALFVVYGKAGGGTVDVAGGTIAASNGYKITGQNATEFGLSVTTAGDMNGDGLTDLIIGAPASISGNGAAFVVYGRTSGTDLDISGGSIAASNGFRLSGIPSLASVGRSVSSAGDINGDGLDDLVIGAPQINSNLGVYYIVLGGTQFVSAAASLTGTTAAEAVMGTAGADTLTGGGGVDRFYAGRGNDTIVLTASDVANLGTNSGAVRAMVDGGHGFDTLRLSGADVDLTAITNVGALGHEEDSRIEGIECIDMVTDTAANTLTLTATDVKDMAGFNLIRTGSVSADGNTWTNVTGTALSANTRFHQLVIEGSANDALVLSPDTGSWFIAGTVSNGSSSYNVYQNLETDSQVLVKSGVGVTNNDPNAAPVFASTSATAAAGLLPVVGGTPVWNRTASYGTSTLGGVTTSITAAGDSTPTTTSTAGITNFMTIGNQNLTEALHTSFGTPVYQVQVEFFSINYDNFNKERLSFKVNGVDLALSSANLSTLTIPGFGTESPSTVSGNFIIGTSGLLTGGVYNITSTTGIDTLTVTNNIVSGGPNGIGVAIRYNTAPLVASAGVAISSLMPAATDADGAVAGYAITTAAAETGADATPGFWQYFNGSAWTSLASASQSQAVYLTASTLVRWSDNDAGYTALSAVAVDNTVGATLGQALDVTTRGGITGFSSVIATLAATVAPVVLDLNRDGTLSYSQVAMDVNGDGRLDATAWAGAQDGVLVWDKHGDAKVHDASQYAFTQYGGKTDLEGLAAGFDTNRDGVFNAQDAKFGQFKVWQDADQDGVSDAGEVRSLADWGITSINLTSDAVQRSPAQGVSEAGRSTAQLDGGGQMLLADTAFVHNQLAYRLNPEGELSLLGEQMDLNLSSFINTHGQISSVDLLSPGAQSIQIELSDLLQSNEVLRVFGGENDSVSLDKSEWLNSGNVTSDDRVYEVYSAVNGSGIDLWIHDALLIV